MVDDFSRPFLRKCRRCGEVQVTFFHREGLPTTIAQHEPRICGGKWIKQEIVLQSDLEAALALGKRCQKDMDSREEKEQGKRKRE